MLKNRKW